MPAYLQVYLNDVVEEQGKLFDMIAQDYPDKDTEDFIQAYMTSHTRKMIDESQAYVNTMFARELLEFFIEQEGYMLKPGKAMEGFAPAWIGEFYAYAQWYYDIPSALLIQKLPLDTMKRMYPGLHDLELSLAVQKVGDILCR